MLRKIAFHMQNTEKGLAGNLIHSEDLEKIMIESLKSLGIRKDERTIARLLIEKLRTRNFILCYLGADYYAFVHRTFLEYFCAWEFVWQFEKEQKIDFEYLKNEVYGKHWKDESWHEVLRLIAGMIDAKFMVEIIEYLTEVASYRLEEKNLFLAAECLAEVRNRSVISSVSKKLFNCVCDVYKKRIWYKREEVMPVLARCFKHEPETLTFLKKSALSDMDHQVQKLALQELAINFKHEPETLTFLKTVAQSRNDKNFKKSAVHIIAWIFKDVPETFNILKNIAQHDEDSDVRYEAIENLIKEFKDAPETVIILKNIAQFDKDSDVRYAVLANLARKFKDAPETLNILKTAAKFDTEATIRQTAVEELIENYPDNSKTLALLKDRAKNDPDERVREYAKEVLKNRFAEDV